MRLDEPERGSPGDAHSTEVQQRSLTATSACGHQHPNLAGATVKRPASPLVRNEEAPT
jgi:hypothetical protein